MKAWLLAVLLLLSASPAWATFAEVGAGSQRATKLSGHDADTASLAFPGNVTSGNVVVVWGATWASPSGPPSISVTDTQSGTYNISSCQSSSNTIRIFIAWRQITTTGALTVTVNPSGATSDFSFTIDEFSIASGNGPSLDTTGPCTTSTGATGSTTPSGTIAPVSPNTLLLGVVSPDSGAPVITPGGSYTQAGESEINANNQAHNAVYRITTTAQTYTVNWTFDTTSTWVMFALALKEGVIDTQAPTTPTGLTCSGQGSDSIICSWNASTDNVGVVDYILERSPLGCASFTAFAPLTVRTFTDATLSANTTYCYRVSARDAVPNTSIVSANVTATTLSTRQATLSWTNHGTYTSIVVQRCGTATNCTNFADYATVSGTATSYVDSTSPTPVAGYRVRATLTGAPDSTNSNTAYTTATVPAILTVSPPSLTYAATVGGSNPPSQSLMISNVAQGSVPMVWTLTDDATWFSCSPASGTNNAVVTCSVTISGLSSGTQFATITIQAPGATNSPTTVLVTLNLAPATNPDVPPSSGRGGRIR